MSPTAASRTKVIVDMLKKFGESETCTSCGACVANCPTGAFFDKATAFRGPLASCKQVMTTCTECPVGCGLKVFIKEDRIINVWGDPDSPVNRGHLCVKGRYETWAEPRERITQPLLRGKDGLLQPVTWDKALAAIRKAGKDAKKTEQAMLIAPRVTNETAQTIKTLAGKVDRVGMYVAANEAALCNEPSFSADAMRKLEDADAIIVIGAQPSRDNGVVAARIRTTVRKRGAKLLIFHARKSDLDQYADVCAHVVGLEHQFWDQVAATLEGAKRPAILYGPNAMTPIGVTVMERLIKVFENNPGGQEPVLIGLPISSNGLALAGAGIEAIEDVGPWLDAKPLKLLHIVASDAPDGGATNFGREICVRSVKPDSVCGGAGQLPLGAHREGGGCVAFDHLVREIRHDYQPGRTPVVPAARAASQRRGARRRGDFGECICMNKTTRNKTTKKSTGAPAAKAARQGARRDDVVERLLGLPHVVSRSGRTPGGFGQS